MPNMTPVWALPYPCPGDTVSAADFMRLNEAIEVGLGALDTLQEQAAQRPYYRWIRQTPTAVATGGSVFFSYTQEDARYAWPVFNQAPVAGLYHFSLQVDPGDNSAAVLLSENIRITFGTYPGEIANTRYNPTGLDIGMWKACVGVAPLSAGETYTIGYDPTGTAGTVTFQYAAFQARLIQRF